MPTHAQNDSLPDRLVTRAMLRNFTPVSDMTLFRWMRDGKFPRPIARSRDSKGNQIGSRYWRLSELEAWLEKRTTEREAA